LDVSPYYAAARILHPERRTEWLKDDSGKWKDDEAKQLFWRVQKLWEKFRQSLPRSILLTRNTTTSQADTEANLSTFQRARQKHRQKESRLASLDEFEAYHRETPSYEVGRSLIDWWLHDSQQARFPQLSLFAIEVLSILALSDKPERVFSGTRRMISWDRTQLSHEVIEESECLKDWKDSGILNFFP
jgi:hypothetical protein